MSFTEKKFVAIHYDECDEQYDPEDGSAYTGLRRKAPGFSHGGYKATCFFLVFGSVSSFRFLIR